MDVNIHIHVGMVSIARQNIHAVLLRGLLSMFDAIGHTNSKHLHAQLILQPTLSCVVWLSRTNPPLRPFAPQHQSSPRQAPGGYSPDLCAVLLPPLPCLPLRNLFPNRKHTLRSLLETWIKSQRLPAAA